MEPSEVLKCAKRTINEGFVSLDQGLLHMSNFCLAKIDITFDGKGWANYSLIKKYYDNVIEQNQWK